MNLNHQNHPGLSILRVAMLSSLFVAVALKAPSGFAQSSAPAAAVATAATGQLRGLVSNAGTKMMLEGAIVSIPALGLSTKTDANGAYSFIQVPAGEHRVEASYSGLDSGSAVVRVAPQQAVQSDISLRSEVYVMSAYNAVAEREGMAAAVTRQRNAESIRVAASFDAYGNLFNNEIGELAVRLPGISGIVGDEGIVSRVSIRGFDFNLNAVTIDGNKMVSTAPRGRQFTMNQLPSGFFADMEVIKALTPDVDSDGPGGLTDLKTRSATKLGDKRYQMIEFTTKWAPPFYAHNPFLRDRALHGFGAYTYRERFSVLGGDRNLAVSFNLTYRENHVGGFNTNNTYQAVTTSPAIITATNLYEFYNNRKSLGGMLRLDYQLTPNVSAFATVMYNNAYEPAFRFFRFGSANAATVASLDAAGQPTGTGAVLPGYTERRAEVTAQPTSTATISSEGNRFKDIQRQRSFGLVHNYGALKLNYNVMHGDANVEQNDRESGGIFTTTISGIGFIEQRLGNGMMSWSQTAGPSVFNIGNYPTHLLTFKGRKRLNGINAITFNAEYQLDAQTKTFLKTGARIRAESSNIAGGDRRFTYAGPDGVAGVNPATGRNDSDLSVFLLPDFKARSGMATPFVDVAKIAADVRGNPSRWIEDLYFRRQQDYTQTSGANEQVNSAYLMGGGTWVKNLRFTGGVRVENTRIRSKAFVQSVPLGTTTQYPDPIARADHDFNNPRRVQGEYTNWFPNGLLTYNISRNLVTRFNYSNSLGRPSFGILVPLETVNAIAQTVTIANPSIKPQAVRSFEASLEYYWEPMGVFTVGAFRKDIKNYILSRTSGFVPTGANNGYDGDYAGYTIIQNQNVGGATVRGFEANYQQQLKFLPGLLSGLGVMANYTRVLPEGDFGSVGPRTTNLIPLFVPISGNAGVTFRWKKLLTRVQWNYTGRYLNVYSTNAALLAYIDERRTVNASVSYALTPRVRVHCDVANVFDEPNRQYLYQTTRRSLQTYNGTWINAGFRAEF